MMECDILSSYGSEKYTDSNIIRNKNKNITLRIEGKNHEKNTT